MATRKTTAADGVQKLNVQIKAPNLQVAVLELVGTAPYVQNKFSAKARQKMHDDQAAGHTSKKGAKKDPKDFQAMYQGAIHHLPDGGYGIPAPAFRNAAISACRICGFHMTQAKLAVFVQEDGFDPTDQTPLVRLAGEPEYFETYGRNDNGGVDLRARPMWQPGWRITLRVKFDADMFTLTDIMNLFDRVGQQVGVGEGRPDSKKSAGQGWGLFRIMNEEEVKKDLKKGVKKAA